MKLCLCPDDIFNVTLDLDAHIIDVQKSLGFSANTRKIVALYEGRRRRKSVSLAESESCQKVSWILHMKHRSIKFRKHPNRLVKINQHITENNAEQSNIDEGAQRRGTLNDVLKDMHTR